MGGGYEPLAGRRRAVVAVFGALFIVDLVAVGFSLLELDLVDRLEAGELVSDAELEADDTRQGTIGLVQVALYLTCAVLFIRWLRRAYRNTDVLAPGLRRHGHGWAIGAWFVPILNLWRPKQIINDVWRAGATSPQTARPPVLLLAWWLSWIASTMLSQAAFRTAADQETLDELRTVDLLYIVSDGWDAIVAVMAIVVVRQITRRMDAKAKSGAPPAAATEDPASGSSVAPPPAGGGMRPTGSPRQDDGEPVADWPGRSPERPLPPA